MTQYYGIEEVYYFSYKWAFNAAVKCSCFFDKNVVVLLTFISLKSKKRKNLTDAYDLEILMLLIVFISHINGFLMLLNVVVLLSWFKCVIGPCIFIRF